MRRIVVLVAILLGALQAQAQPRPLLILISLDGFRWDYPEHVPVPNLRSLIVRGVRAKGLIPSFPSKTFPNHYSIVTGLYPGHHGIVANNILDPATGRRFAMNIVREVQDPLWWGGEPLWVSVQRAGLLAAAMYWPGTEAPIQGIRPRYWMPFASLLPPLERIDRVLQWVDLPEADRPSFITLYFSEVDSAGHASGPDSRQVRSAITEVDGYLGRLLRGLEQRRVLDRTNIVVISDHGMAATDRRRVIVLDDYISLDDVDIVDINPTLGLVPKAGREADVYRALSRAPHLKVYRRAGTPEHWHYRDHARIPPIVGVADEGWQVVQRSGLRQILAGLTGGAHGYDPEVKSMRGIFIAAGPAFKQHATIDAFENIHIYNALARALGVTPAPNDGDPAIARRFLK
jgi:predicted AlkP superfamily pyrophosphatase or phosphodiesterase